MRAMNTVPTITNVDDHGARRHTPKKFPARKLFANEQPGSFALGSLFGRYRLTISRSKSRIRADSPRHLDLRAIDLAENCLHANLAIFGIEAEYGLTAKDPVLLI
jgi:hypothetical protein